QSEVPTAVTDGIAYIEGYNVNLRKGPGTSYSKIRQLNKPESYIVWAEKDGWLNLGGDQWIKNDSSYVNFYKKSTVDSSIVGKRVVSKVNNLRFYDVPSWQDKDVAGSVDAGLGFTIDAKVNVNGSSQYKVHNSKGKVYYVTANKNYVYVK
ncbi:TPA: N-acetylmuramoyl-L-alanine amidase, partial [Bacillus cereus]|nr:N-acetylmuramoyl-L-alanine amidase [Bacillus cereus]